MLVGAADCHPTTHDDTDSRRDGDDLGDELGTGNSHVLCIVHDEQAPQRCQELGELSGVAIRT